ncbi:hypothetical protein BSL78_06483 [Apostichopus japonicus]|uniref:Ig-like domain-containing protein n=1 Tax=Stichopus japonicus TaxID=307972 RepID=A0A2G8L8N4_STIJA|nr:hypothetical protein BSL78_06483 [Apostichopus japonicus]
MLKCETAVLTCLFWMFITDAQQGAVAVCYAGNGSLPGQVTTCESSQCEPVCLVCGDHLTKRIKWMTANVLIAQGNYTFGVISGSKVNTCHGNSSSLRLDSCHERISKTIRCELDNYVLAEFRLKNSANEILTIVGDTFQYAVYNLTLARGLNVSLLCVIQNALPPVTLEWRVDERLIYTERFTSNKTNNFSLQLLINSSNVQETITCNSYGEKQNMSQQLLITNSSTTTENPETPLMQIGMAVAFLLAAIFTIIIFFMKLYNNCKEKG